ncbi:MAG: hypothetical protein ACD_34C00575G0001 [uncultured bacterium]|nr:MAG: hypothetical protein ACD_34C00575G0001 [uncultured bacterium]
MAATMAVSASPSTSNFTNPNTMSTKLETTSATLIRFFHAVERFQLMTMGIQMLVEERPAANASTRGSNPNKNVGLV